MYVLPRVFYHQSSLYKYHVWNCFPYHYYLSQLNHAVVSIILLTPLIHYHDTHKINHDTQNCTGYLHDYGTRYQDTHYTIMKENGNPPLLMFLQAITIIYM